MTNKIEMCEFCNENPVESEGACVECNEHFANNPVNHVNAEINGVWYDAELMGPGEIKIHGRL